MKKFLAVYLGSETSPAAKAWDALDEKTRNERTQAGIKAWGDWVARNRASIVETGSPLGSTKKVDSRGLSDISNLLSAFTIVQAESHEAAAKLFIDHPHFKIFPGDSVEIMECLPIPGQ